jgi:putative component of toxin-antitoxin plasmid stabilization module
MPATTIHFYRELDGRSPVLEWLTELRRGDRKAYAKCVALVKRLAEFGHELRRPHADHLRDGVYELRAKLGHVNYRLLYFFAGRDIAVVACGLTKERDVPAVEIDRAIERRRRYEQNPTQHQASYPIAEA